MGAVVVLAVAAAACDGDASEIDESGAIVATTDPLTSSAGRTVVGAPLAVELLIVDEMPEAGLWHVADLPADFWADDRFYEPFSVHMCDPMVGSVWTIVPPADEQHRVGRVLEGRGTVMEAVFSGDSSELMADFEAITHALTDCLEGPADTHWEDAGYELVAEELSTAGVGDADFLIRQRLYFLDGELDRLFCDHRLAVVVDGSRLVLVEYTAMHTTESMSDDDFTLMVQNAAQRVAS